jgi:hypothetical protein
LWEEGAEPATGAEPEPTDERPADPASQTETLPFEFD